MSVFFIERPIFAWVIAILMMLAGGLAVLKLPVSQYPDVAPPLISIGGAYPGASAQTVQDTVVQIIEQEMNGLDGYQYMTSSSTADGGFSIDITFRQGTNPDVAQVQVQNKLESAVTLLPAEVRQQGVSAIKSQESYIMQVALYCEDGSMDEDDLGDLMNSKIKDTLTRVNGVGNISIWGKQYAMRIWLQPDKLYEFKLIPQDVVSAIQEQNAQVSAGQIGGTPASPGLQLTATIIAKSRFTSADQFRNILLKVNKDGSQVRLKDVAKVEIGSEDYAFTTDLNGHPDVGMGVRLAAGANVLDTTKAVRAAVDHLKPLLPSGAKVVYISEIAPVVYASIKSVLRTLAEAVLLVFCVMWLFLQRFRITLIPTLTVPVILLGTCVVLWIFHFSVNVITMFAMVLAIGLLVDDAIVVVENVERLMDEEGLDAKAATVKSMRQIQGALVGIALVISAVFLPMAFFGGVTGVIYRQFSVTIISAMTLSAFIALTFTPALCATMLKGGKKHRVLFPFRWFNAIFAFFTRCYAGCVGYFVRRSFRVLVIYGALIFLIVHLYPKMPTTFLPTEDQGQLSVSVDLPPNTTMERTKKVLKRVSDYFIDKESDTVESIMGITGFSQSGTNQNSGMAFITLKPFEERQKPGMDVFSIVERANQEFSQIYQAQLTSLVPSSIPELEDVSGLGFYLLDTAGFGHHKMTEIQHQFLTKARQSGVFDLIEPLAQPDEPQYSITIDEEKMQTHSITLADVNDSMSIVWGGTDVGDFVDRGRVKKIYVQGEAKSRATQEDIHQWFVRNKQGDMVPFSSFSTGKWITGPSKLSRFNGFEGIEFMGVNNPSVSSGTAMNKIAELVKELPQGVGLSYTGLSFEEQKTGNQTLYLYAISLVVIFLCLAALYESWSIPMAVLMAVPFGVLGAITAVLMRQLSNDVYFQVGILTVMGVSAKNAILIVEFAQSMYNKEGKSLWEAVVEAARIRLRPIMMTSMAFVLGVLPMSFAHGASSVSQHSLGTSVIGGTLGATFLAIFFVPVFYVFVVKLFSRVRRNVNAEK